jgi:DNA polymerase-3 subunit epsilon
MLDFLFHRKPVGFEAESRTKNFLLQNPLPAKPRSNRFAVVDVETTGVYVHKDRIIEIAIIELCDDGTVLQEYCTLVNPGRDLGPTNVHGINAADVALAPTFQEVAGDILVRLKDSIIVGHNISFDWQLLCSEFERLDISLPSEPLICTMSLASRLGLHSRKLIDCCKESGISPGSSHCALDDARSAMQLFMSFRKHHVGLRCIEEKITQRLDYPEQWPDLRCSGKTFNRRTIAERQPHFLKNLISHLPESGTASGEAYSHALEKVLEDRIVSLEETNELVSIAEKYGMSKNAVVEAHLDYLRRLIGVVLADGRVSSAERSDLDTVAYLVGLDSAAVDTLLRAARKEPIQTHNFDPHSCGLEGKRVCFTGATASSIGGQLISREHALQLAAERGLIPTDSVTKKTDILVLADPSSMSGKAKKAREYGIRLMSDRVFWQTVGIQID